MERRALDELAGRLRAVHKALIAVTRQKHEGKWGPVDASQLLQLLTRHPDFQWLQALSGFMAEVDALRDRKDITAGEAQAAYDRARLLFWPSEQDASTFATIYRGILHDAPELVLEHASLKLLLDQHPAFRRVAV